MVARRNILHASRLDQILYVPELNIPLERHVRQHDAHILRSDVAVSVEIVHVERKLHLLVQVSDEDVREISDK